MGTVVVGIQGEMSMLTVMAPAKINLTLEVLAKRSDGFHEIRSVIQTISLCDSLCLRPSQSIEFKCGDSRWIAKKSLLPKALELLQKDTGCCKGAIIEVSKRIPLVAGLGGDSSGAAAILRGLNQLWDLGLKIQGLVGLASQLGSDVAFFLYGGTALVESRGEVVTPLPPLPHMWVIMVVPEVPRLPGKTKQLYASLKASHYTDGQITERLLKTLREGSRLSVLFNTVENVAFDCLSELGVYREHMVKLGAIEVHLAGSGPALFTLLDDRAQAEELYIRFQQQGLEVYLAETLEAIEPL
ncbi:4-(cytidine 5'-diphospho)-2-C-methyl-D-erythritol kinase [Chloroflexota bacterium]